MGKEIKITGIIMVLIGITLLVLTKFNPVGLIYGLIITIIGIALIFWNKEEDKIEKRRDKK